MISLLDRSSLPLKKPEPAQPALGYKRNISKKSLKGVEARLPHCAGAFPLKESWGWVENWKELSYQVTQCYFILNHLNHFPGVSSYAVGNISLIHILGKWEQEGPDMT